MDNRIPIKTLLEKYGLSEEILAGKMGVSTGTIRNWERRKTNPGFAEKKLLRQIFWGYELSQKRKAPNPKQKVR